CVEYKRNVEICGVARRIQGSQMQDMLAVSHRSGGESVEHALAERKAAVRLNEATEVRIGARIEMPGKRCDTVRIRNRAHDCGIARLAVGCAGARVGSKMCGQIRPVFVENERDVEIERLR